MLEKEAIRTRAYERGSRRATVTTFVMVAVSVRSHRAHAPHCGGLCGRHCGLRWEARARRTLLLSQS